MAEALWKRDLDSTYIEYENKINLTEEDEKYLNVLWSELLYHIRRFGNLTNKHPVIMYDGGDENGGICWGNC